MFFKMLLKSFYYASEGIVYTINTQRNMRIHVSFALFILLFGMALHITKTETIILLLLIGIVFFAEIINTSLEKIVDTVTKDFHPLAKAAKDAAAGAVLFFTLVSIFIGILLFQPYIKSFYLRGWCVNIVHTPSFFILEAFYIIILTFMLKAFWYSRIKAYQPSIFLGIIIFIVSLVGTYYNWITYSLISVTIMSLIVFMKKKNILIKLFQNYFISIGLFYLLYWLLY